MWKKFYSWINEFDEWVYINDENDEIVKYISNGEILLGFSSVIVLIIIFVLFNYIVL